MKTLLISLLALHGFIHIFGFIKAFHFADLHQLKQAISKPAGTAWLMTCILFLSSAVSLALGASLWWMLASGAVALSQTLIVLSWGDAKFGSMANAIILLPVSLAFLATLPSGFQSRYRLLTETALGRPVESRFLGEEDIRDLPEPVRKYLRYTGSIGKEKIRNVRAVFHGWIRTKINGNWLDFISSQHNFFGDHSRYFLILSDMYGVPFDGLHVYENGKATMEIKIASLLKVVDAKGPKMNQGETVTVFNDMCLLAPATLIDKSIRWETIDSLTVRAKFTNRGITISAVLQFNNQGELTCFTSNDRFLSEDGKTYLNYPWTTPVRDYKEYAGRKIASYGEAIWRTPARDYCYGKFSLSELAYNCARER
jgi:hypothetical protein